MYQPVSPGRISPEEQWERSHDTRERRRNSPSVVLKMHDDIIVWGGRSARMRDSNKAPVMRVSEFVKPISGSML